MAIPNVDINYLAVFVSAIVSMIIGFLWYSPALFGKAWMKAGNMNMKDMDKAKKKGMGKLYFLAFIGALLMAFVLAYFVGYLTAYTFFEGMEVGAYIWLGFIFPVLLGSFLWEGRSVKYYLINVLYWLINLAVMGGILAIWQ
ncbi:MAG: DUF1761 domain-containing protein [Nanoarchaeota archaeon]